MYGRDALSSSGIRSYSSLRHGSGPLAGYTRSTTTSRTGGLADRYLQTTNRGNDSSKFNSYTIPSRTNELKSRFEGVGSSKSDDIIIPPPEEKPRINIGGRYLQRVNSREGANEGPPARSSWRESVYGVQYNQSTASATPNAATLRSDRKLSELEKKRVEQEKRGQNDKLRQQSHDEDQEGKKLRPITKKTTREKDGMSIADCDSEVYRPQIKRQDSSRKEKVSAESKPLPRQFSFRDRETSGWKEKNRVNVANKGEAKNVQDETQIAMSFTDFDEYLKVRLGGKEKDCPWCTYYPDTEADDLGGEVSIVYKTKRAKELFTKMPTELQHLVVRAQKRPVGFAAIMDLCKTDKFGKEFSVESEHNFKGYNNVTSMMTDFGFDMAKLENCVLQIYRFGAEQNYFGSYLDIDSTLQEQWEDVKGLSDDNDSVAIVLRTKSVVRVQAIINRLYSAKGQELRRALFSLKQIFMNDKDLVHDFVTHSGLTCLVTVGSQSEHTHQNYILRALGQLILYVDGMAGVSEHPETIRWLYSLLSCKFSLVKKTALHLLSVFVGYADTNANIFVETVDDFHKSSKVNGKPWSYIIELLRNESGDLEFCQHTMLLINKVLAAVPDQETFYDITDSLEDQGMKEIADMYLKQPNADPVLVEQLLIYEASLILEDGGSTNTINLEEKSLGGLRRTPRPRRAELVGAPTDAKTPETSERRRSKRFGSNGGAASDLDKRKLHGRGITDGLLVDSRRHTEELQRKTVRDLYENVVVNESPVEEEGSEKDMGAVQEGVEEEKQTEPSSDIDENSDEHYVTISVRRSTNEEKLENNGTSASVKALRDQHNGATINSQTLHDSSKEVPVKTGSVSATKEKLAASIGRLPTGLSSSASPSQEKVEEAKPEPEKLKGVDYFWMDHEKKVASRALKVKDRTFDDLESSDDEKPIGAPKIAINGSIPPPPPPPPPPMGDVNRGAPPPPPPPPPGGIPPPPPPPLGKGVNSRPLGNLPPPPGARIPKHGRTVKLHWSEWIPKPKDIEALTNAAKTSNKDKVDFSISKKGPLSGPMKEELQKKAIEELKDSTIWSHVVPVNLDYNRIEELFENKLNEVKVVKHDTATKKIEILDVKRSNAINIGMKVLPPLRTISSALIKMDSSVINREGIEQLLTTMLPTEEEREKIMAAKREHGDIQLGKAEEFLLTLSEVSHLKARLELWLFKLDYETMEADIIDPLTDLKQAVFDIQESQTLRCILSVILAIGNFLNSSESRGFNPEYLDRLPEVKDTKHKHSLLHHVCQSVLELFPESTDLHSEMGAVCRCHRVAWDELDKRLVKVENDCRRAWEHYQTIYCSSNRNFVVNNKLADFIADAADRIITMKIVKRRTIKRFRQLLVYLGYPQSRAESMAIGHFCRILAEFSLEYRTTRERILEQNAKKANNKERKQTRGKLIDDVLAIDEGLKHPHDVPHIRTTPVSKQQAADDMELRQVLSSRRESILGGKRHKDRGLSPCLPSAASDLVNDRDRREASVLLDACERASSVAPSGGSVSRRGPSKERRRVQERTRQATERILSNKISDIDMHHLENILRRPRRV